MGQTGGRGHDAHDAAGRHALERAEHGQGCGAVADDGAADLEAAPPAAAPSGELQVLQRSALCGPACGGRDVVGLYLNPPAHALVLSVDEKSQIQALDRTQPLLPLRPGLPARQTHDYKRHGTTTLFAALNMLDGKVSGQCLQRHRSQEFIRFLKKIDQQTPAGLDLHLIVDNYSTHKSPMVKRWLARHKRFGLHFVPTGSSWLNMVEHWFGEITRKRIRRGTFKSVRQLIDAITEYLDHHNGDPVPFVWTKDADTIIAKISRCKEALGTAY